MVWNCGVWVGSVGWLVGWLVGVRSYWLVLRVSCRGGMDEG